MWGPLPWENSKGSAWNVPSLPFLPFESAHVCSKLHEVTLGYAWCGKFIVSHLCYGWVVCVRTSSFLKSRRVVYLGIFIMLNELPLAARLYRYQLISIFLPKTGWCNDRNFSRGWKSFLLNDQCEMIAWDKTNRFFFSLQLKKTSFVYWSLFLFPSPIQSGWSGSGENSFTLQLWNPGIKACFVVPYYFHTNIVHCQSAEVNLINIGDI